jgi:2-C-methyl-D-erythritol 2,4-cyclodiphosphate synthase
VVLLERVEEPSELQTMSAVMESQRQLEDVVRDLVSQVHGVAVKAPFDTDDIT